MHSSTSNSNQRLPTKSWLSVWIGVLMIAAGLILVVEYDLRRSGWQPSVVDSPQLWIAAREKASLSGRNALVLVGASRIQLGIDIDVIRENSQFEPIQLAIDGSPIIPVLENLAADPQVLGSIVLSINAHNISNDEPQSRASEWISDYQNRPTSSYAPYRIIDDKISGEIANILVTRLSGAKPITVITTLAFRGPSTGNYLTTHYDRSRDADYRKVTMPDFYMNRLRRHYGEELTTLSAPPGQILATYTNAIKNLQPVDPTKFFVDLDYLMRLVKHIEARGSNVFFVRFPTDKLIWAIDRARYPRTKFWDKIAQRHTRSIHFRDYPSLSRFSLPDGSHLDVRDKKSFTLALLTIINDWNKKVE